MDIYWCLIGSIPVISIFYGFFCLCHLFMNIHYNLRHCRDNIRNSPNFNLWMKIAGSSSLLRNVHFEVPSSGGKLLLIKLHGVSD